jgi:hypothetical protein
VTPTAIPLAGGLDLTTPGPQTKPGTLADCLNYEVASRRGYSRIGGFEPHDGGPGVAQHRVLRLSLSNQIGGFAVGDIVRFDGTGFPHRGVDGYVVAITQLPAGAATAWVVFGGGMGDPLLPDTLEGAVSASTAIVTAYLDAPVPEGTQLQFDLALSLLAATRRQQVDPVPGRAGSDVLGGFLFKDESYAIRDLPRAFFENGYYTDADEGGIVTIGATQHQILEVRVLGDNAGFIAYDPRVASGGTPAAGINSPTLTTLPVGGSVDNGFVGISFLDGLTVSGGVAPYQWSLGEDAQPPPAPAPITDLSKVQLLAEVTPAALWRAKPEGWELIDGGREMQFVEGTGILESMPRSVGIPLARVRSTPWSFGAINELDGANVTASIGADGGPVLTLSGANSNSSIAVRDFNFDSVPDGAEIVGVEVNVQRRALTANSIRDNLVVLTGISGSDNKGRGRWATGAGPADTFYGGEDDLWGSENISASTIADPSFGVLVIPQQGTVGPMSGEIDFVQMRVHYVERAGVTAYCYNGATDVEITIRNVQFSGGDSLSNTATGFLTINAAKNIDKVRLIDSGEGIYSEPSGGGSLLARVASRDRPIFLPGQFEVDNNRSQYLWEENNFFAQDKFAAMYGVSGAGPAVAFDGSTMIKIHSPLSPGQDIPRHVAKHGQMLALGYLSGAVLLSAVGDPYEFRGELGATSFETGDRLTALTAGGGDSLIIVCEKRTELLRGLSPIAFSPSTISARRGALEYTLADPGIAIIADNFGLFSANTPESFEAAERQYLSTPVQPWLRERLQATISNEQRQLRPVCALAVRSKNQYRLYFRDGAILTLTSSSEGVEITRQRYFDPAQPEVGFPVRRVWSGFDASGRERLFCSFAGVKSGFVFEMDQGRTFDGAPILARGVLNPINSGSISQLKMHDRLFFSGAGGFASLGWAFHADLDRFDDAVATGATLGRDTDPPAPENGSRRTVKAGSVQVGIECYELAMGFESLTDSEAPHTLQYLELYLSSRGASRGDTGD